MAFHVDYMTNERSVHTNTISHAWQNSPETDKFIIHLSANKALHLVWEAPRGQSVCNKRHFRVLFKKQMAQPK